MNFSFSFRIFQQAVLPFQKNEEMQPFPVKPWKPIELSYFSALISESLNFMLFQYKPIPESRLTPTVLPRYICMQNVICQSHFSVGILCWYAGNEAVSLY